MLKEGGGGRVTELVARPLINLFYPELSGFIQPLAGEYAGRRSLLETAALLHRLRGRDRPPDRRRRAGSASRASARSTWSGGSTATRSSRGSVRMSFVILQAVMKRLEERRKARLFAELGSTMKLPRSGHGRLGLEVIELADHERPPMIRIPEYLEKRGGRDDAADVTSPRPVGATRRDLVQTAPRRSTLRSSRVAHGAWPRRWQAGPGRPDDAPPPARSPTAARGRLPRSPRAAAGPSESRRPSIRSAVRSTRRWLRSNDGAVAVVEMAAASGLSRLTLAERDPLGATTAGTGADPASRARCRRPPDRPRDRWQRDDRRRGRDPRRARRLGRRSMRDRPRRPRPPAGSRSSCSSPAT